MPLIAFSTGRPRNGAPESSIRMHHALSRVHRCLRKPEATIRATCHILFSCFLFQIEFPRLLAKREIIANAYFLPTKFLGQLLQMRLPVCKSNHLNGYKGIIWDFFLIITKKIGNNSTIYQVFFVFQITFQKL